jgi:hypothetical protein
MDGGDLGLGGNGEDGCDCGKEADVHVGGYSCEQSDS